MVNSSRQDTDASNNCSLAHS